ncbi:Replication factor A 51 kDa subunit [Frankliniella fusca]|uniref:Replication factor A 51 kDa subunit n=1 Tax=Frankliniella fusca TaxID=407009 RepID=A0AAE1HPM9_9NEOP|nr:Replication factor A 51 kDa subunit [Frankliniella fusca]
MDGAVMAVVALLCGAGATLELLPTAPEAEATVALLPAAPEAETNVALMPTATAPGAEATLGLRPAAPESAPPEAKAVAALLLPLLLQHNAGVVVIGRPRWTASFLHALSPETPRLLLAGKAMYEDSDRLALEVMERHHVLLIALDLRSSALCSTPRVYRTLFWATVAQPAEDVVRNATVVACLTRTRLCNDQVALALTTPDGSTTLYIVRESSCPYGRRTAELDRWSPEGQRWLRAKSPFYPFCDTWLPPPPGGHLTIYALTPKSAFPVPFTFFDTLVVNGTQPWRVRIVHRTTSSIDDSFQTAIGRALRSCHMDALLHFYEPQPAHPYEVAPIYAIRRRHVSIVVPAGLGPAPFVLAAITLEFSPTVWWSTALAALCTAAALACALRRDRGAAPLLALAPLLAQAPPPPPGPGPGLRPLLGAWLLVCVVLAAAYQGLLLGRLLHRRPRGEIDNMRALEESGLPVYTTSEVFIAVEGSLPKSIRDRVLVWRHGLPEDHIYQEVALARRCAIIVGSDTPIWEDLLDMLVPRKLVHFFELTQSTQMVVGLTHRGSPLHAAIVDRIARIRDSGLLLHRQMLRTAQRSWATERSRETVRPELGLRHMYPAFLVLLGGLGSAAVAFVAELSVSFLTSHCCSLRPREPARLPGRGAGPAASRGHRD